MRRRRSRFSALLLPSLAAACCALVLARKMSLVTADLGRHLKNGEALLSGAPVLRANYYSYTAPAFPVLNHHWGSGAVFYLVWKALGFAGLHAFWLGTSLAAFLIFLDAARREAGGALASFAALLTIPMLAQRAEIRPEAFSYLLCAIFFKLLADFRAGRAGPRALFLLPVLEALWVNLHICFFMGPVLIAAFWIESLARGPRRGEDVRRLLLALLLASAATLLNPFGLKGALAPADIFNNYGYMLAENQPVWFMEKRLPSPVYPYFKAVFALLALSFALAWRSARPRFSWAEAGLGALVSAMAWLAIRNLAIFGLFSIPLLAKNAAAALDGRLTGLQARLRGPAAGGLIAALAALVLGGARVLAPGLGRPGLGLEAGDGASAEFFKAAGLGGPVLNNYDIGSYLVFHLFPAERVFVDNRPEAYPEDFFDKTYVPLQSDERAWRKEDARWGFNAIFFYRRDQTPWAQPFLIRRLNDPGWAPVFADGYALILVRRSPRNADAIRRFEIPRGRFSVSR